MSMLLRLVEIAKNKYNSNTFDIDNYDNRLKGYNNDTRGIDVWTATEIRKLLIECKKMIADGMENTFKQLA